MKKSLFFFAVIACTGCYQIHSDDDLRTVPTTNNPDLIPANLRNQPSIGPFMASATAGDRERATRNQESVQEGVWHKEWE